MILLETHNVVLRDTLTKRFSSTQADPLDITFVDFDGVTYHLHTPTDDFHQLQLSVRWACFPQLLAYGAEALLQQQYKPFLSTTPEQGWHVTFDIDPRTIEGSKGEDVIRRFSLLKRNLMAAPFEHAFALHQQGDNGQSILTVPYREEESIFIRPQSDRVTVIFSTTFKDETDRIFGKVFLQEFVDARRQPAIQNAPQVLYSNKEPPLEIRHLPNLASGDTIGYVTFVLFPRHFETDEAREKTIDQIQMFRDYLHYHIKCSKAYMHTRMRARVSDFLKVINRAKPARETGERKTIHGRTFTPV
ncbi:actin-like protein ARPC2 [Syncephalis pseudoplumigaleata]|uniref:Arp2/3 complex 34 kDa subunit n=1 Tax=Syncephalis pseudoplumigaleata TaxID=1712513 RepID=A0A4P9Z0V2_9FUNG|nr:actin-like protein ARPC2 [Syncephalis pseudoplumigaleata]|eukprot:RKP26034.1 actin-like protein ARPC2 [Syncephalis pseudoplumigaleata]